MSPAVAPMHAGLRVLLRAAGDREACLKLSPPL